MCVCGGGGFVHRSEDAVNHRPEVSLDLWEMIVQKCLESQGGGGGVEGSAWWHAVKGLFSVATSSAAGKLRAGSAALPSLLPRKWD